MPASLPTSGIQLGRFRLPLSDHTPKIARDLSAAVANAWALDGITDRVKLAVSEVVTNSFTHGVSTLHASVIVEIARVDTAFHLTVHDGSNALPQPREAQDADENGRGLLLLEAMADDFGWYPTPFGKAVWFSMRAQWPSDVVA